MVICPLFSPDNLAWTIKTRRNTVDHFYNRTSNRLVPKLYPSFCIILPFVSAVLFTFSGDARVFRCKIDSTNFTILGQKLTNFSWLHERTAVKRNGNTEFWTGISHQTFWFWHCRRQVFPLTIQYFGYSVLLFLPFESNHLPKMLIQNFRQIQNSFFKKKVKIDAKILLPATCTRLETPLLISRR